MRPLIQCLLLIATIPVRGQSNSWSAWDSLGCVARCEKHSEGRQCLGNDPSPCYGSLHRSSSAKRCSSKSEQHHLQDDVYALVQGPLVVRLNEDDHLKLTVPTAVRSLLKKRGVKIEDGCWMRDWHPLTDDGGAYRTELTLHLPYIRSSESGIYAFVITIHKFQLVAALNTVLIAPPDNVIDLTLNETRLALPCLLNTVECFTYSVLWYRDGALQSHLNNSRELRIADVGWTSSLWTCAVFAEELRTELSLTSYRVNTVSFMVLLRERLLPQYQVGLIALGAVVAVSILACVLWPSAEDDEAISDEMSRFGDKELSQVEDPSDPWIVDTV